MMELLMSVFVITLALTALLGVFAAGVFGMRGASRLTTAEFLADAQMETFRGMTSRDIGIDVTATLDNAYKNDSACANASTSTTCAGSGVSSTETAPTGATPDTCTTINGWFPNTLPCTPSRSITSATTPASPDGLSYRIDTYVVQLAATTALRTRKQVTVVVRPAGALSQVFARESSIFDCATAVTPNSNEC